MLDQGLMELQPLGLYSRSHAEPGSEFAELERFPYQILNLEFSTSVCSHEHLKLIYTVHVTKRINLVSFFHPLLFDVTPLQHFLGHCYMKQTKKRLNNLQADSFLAYNPDQFPNPDRHVHATMNIRGNR